MQDYSDLERMLREERRKQILAGHDWDVADALAVVRRWDREREDADMDITEAKARRLADACNGLGLAARFYYDRGPYACQVFLTNDHDEYAPAIFFILEETSEYQITVNGQRIGWRWHGQIRLDPDAIGFEQQGDIEDCEFTILERTVAGDDEHATARKINALVSMLDVRVSNPA